MTSGYVCVQLRISGRVQGVFFRQSTKEQADRLGVFGWVRNLPDGDVEALLEGAPEQVEALVRWCHTGPPAARVDAVERADVHSTGGLQTFDVRR